ncbi:hypothetical protein QCD60_30195 [Pokkaliibacter sp. MBI-7]|uniref:hypothetical protein n=1 Tax=Pokkaliibacter sp. MBI-7 TaxID=3040600 RepID=UPI002446ADC2|nr:hypothetical protein [Pokkaliibacter sp. MBI-7]MDH2430992.1 hypothetical protein [Pokkaliibacter sp. MBI-7]MDH2436787.1 hypothetical protein [Pokkaliibacter sp. MBI-7]
MKDNGMTPLIKQAMQDHHVVVLVGATGAGKSVAAYQALDLPIEWDALGRLQESPTPLITENNVILTDVMGEPNALSIDYLQRHGATPDTFKIMICAQVQEEAQPLLEFLRSLGYDRWIMIHIASWKTRAAMSHDQAKRMLDNCTTPLFPQT